VTLGDLVASHPTLKFATATNRWLRRVQAAQYVGDGRNMGDLGGVARAWLPKAIRASASIEELPAFLNHARTPDRDDMVGLWHHTSVVKQDGRFLILAGDQLQFIADSEGGAHAHLVGCAMSTSYILHRYSDGQIDLTR